MVPLYQGFKLWNDIPFVLKSKPYKIFAKELKKTLSDDTHHTVLKLDSIYLLAKGLPISLNHDLNTFMAETFILKLKSQYIISTIYLLVYIHYILKALNYSINSNFINIYLLIENFNSEIPISRGLVI